MNKRGRPLVQDIFSGTKTSVPAEEVTKLDLGALVQQTKEQGGASVKIDGTTPTDGYMAAELGGIHLPAEKFFGGGGPKALFDFLRDHADQFDEDPNLYLGLWYDVDNDVVTIDVSHNVADRQDAILFGQYQDQRSIWDVVRQEEIDTGGTGGYGDREEGVRPPGQEDLGDDGRRTDGVVRAGSREPAPAGSPEERRYIRRQPALSPTRLVDAPSSMAALGPREWGLVNNGGGNLQNPVHTKEGAGALTASMLEMADHYEEILRAAQDGIPERSEVTPEELAEAHLWYQQAHDLCEKIRKDFLKQYPNATLTIEQVTGVMAAMSPRVGWEDNITAAQKVIAAHLAGLPDDMTQARAMTNAGLEENVEIALRILRGEGPEVMTGLKRKSFWNCMLNPNNDWDVCVDGWMCSALRRAGITGPNGEPLDETALAWLNDKHARYNVDVTEGEGYIILADAIRVAAARVGLTPLQAQALYWVSVGGGKRNVPMWTDERRARGTSPLAQRKARLAAEEVA